MLFAVMVLYALVPVVGWFDRRTVTATVEPYLRETSYTLDGIVIRDEWVLPTDHGQTQPVVSDGQAVSAGTTVAVSGDDGISTPVAGVYFCQTDGLEVLTPAHLTDITPDGVDRLFALCGYTDASAGKVITGFAWYLASVVPSDIAAQLTEGASIPITPSTNAHETVSAVITQISPAQEGLCAVVLRCTAMVPEALCQRYLSVSLLHSTTRGLEIPARAVNRDDGGSFVYVSSAGQVKKHYITILFRENDNVIAEADTAVGALRAGDTLIVSAPNLREGMVVK